MSLASRLSDLTTALGTSIKGVKTLVNGNAADLSALNTVDKSNLVAAINEKANDSRVDVVSNFASPNAGGVISGQYCDNSFHAAASAALAGVANRMDLAPYYTSVDLPIDRLGVAISTAVAGASVKIVIYESDENGWPSNLLYETASLSGAVVAFVEEALTFTFLRGKQYWVGVRHSSTCAVRCVALTSAVNLGLSSNTAANYSTILRRTVTFANAAPNPWNFVNTDRTSNITPPSVRFRAV